MASANAIPSTASTMTLPNAPGLRPTASEAFMPTRPTPIAEPRPHNPTERLPATDASASIGVNMFFLSSFFSTAPAVDHGQAAEISKSMVMFLAVLFFMRANQGRKHRRQEHEHKGLNQADEDFQEIKWHGQQRAENGPRPGRVVDHIGHGFQQIFAGENVSVETETQRDRAERDGNQFEKTHQKENDDHHVLDETSTFPLRPEDVQRETHDPV